MINRQNIEMQYLKLLSVTLMFTAACVSDADGQNERSLAMQEVREIILDQIHQIGSSSAEEGLDWERAIEAFDVGRQSSLLLQLNDGHKFHIELLPVSKKMLLEQVAEIPSIEYQWASHYSRSEYVFETVNANVLQYISSYPTRAGPVA